MASKDVYPSDPVEQQEYWMRQIAFAKSVMEPIWAASEVLRKMYEGDPASAREADMQSHAEQESHLSRNNMNLVFGWIDQTIANLLEHNPVFAVRPQNKAAVPHAAAASSVINYYYRETQQLRQDERCALDAFLGPWGVKKLGYERDVDLRVQRILNQEGMDFGDNVNEENGFLLSLQDTIVSANQDHRFHIEAHELLMEQEGVEEDVLDFIEDHIELHELIRDRPDAAQHADVKFEQPWGQRWNPKDFLIDPQSQDGLKDARWIAFRWRLPIRDVLDNTDYDKKALVDLEPTSRVEGAPDPRDNDELDEFQMVEGWEIWARNHPVDRRRRANMLITVIEGHDQPVQHEEEWPYTACEDYPAEILTFQYTSDSWFTRPSLKLAGADTVQGLANEIMDSFLSMIRKEKNLGLYDSDVFDEETIADLVMAPDMSLFGVRGLSENPNAFRPIQFGAASGDANAYMGIITDQFDRAAGTPQPMDRAKLDTATEASIAERRSNAREARRAGLLAVFQINTSRKWWQMITQFRPKNITLIHPKAEEAISVDAGMAMGEYSFRIDVSSQSAALALERKNWLDLLNLFSGLVPLFMQIYGQPPNIAAIAQRLLTRGYDEQAPEEVLPMVGDEEGVDAQIAKLLQLSQQTDQLQAGGMMAEQGGAPGAPKPKPSQPATNTQANGERRLPEMGGKPREVTEAGAGAGPALPRQFAQSTPSPAREMSSAQTP